jgi:hypothetical protein
VAVGVLMAVMVLTGCSSNSGGVALRSGSEDLAPCEGIDDLLQTVVAVEELNNYEECDLAGAALRFPTGEVLEVRAPGSTGAQESTSVDYRIGWTNWGPDGVAAFVEEDGQFTVWGTRAGIRQQHRAQLIEDPDDAPGLNE